MYPLRKCTLRCTKGEVSKDVDFFVVDKNVRPLLGAQTELNFIKVMVSYGTCPETVTCYLHMVRSLIQTK